MKKIIKIVCAIALLAVVCASTAACTTVQFDSKENRTEVEYSVTVDKRGINEAKEKANEVVNDIVDSTSNIIENASAILK